MIRSRGGYNNNPSAKQFKAAYKQLLVRHEIASSENANCISLSKINILSVGSQGKSKNNFVQNINHDNDRRLSDDLQIIDNSEAATSDHAYSKVPSSKILSEYVEDVVVYISGFVQRKLISAIKCEECSDALIYDENSAENSYHLINRKNKVGLIKPSKDVYQLCKIGEKSFRIIQAAGKITSKNVLELLIADSMRKINTNEPDLHLIKNLKESSHKTYLLSKNGTRDFNAIVSESGLSVNTVISHMTDALNVGLPVQLACFGVTQDIFDTISKVIRSPPINGDVSDLKSIKKLCPQFIKYNHIRAVTAILESKFRVNEVSLEKDRSAKKTIPVEVVNQTESKELATHVKSAPVEIIKHQYEIVPEPTQEQKECQVILCKVPLALLSTVPKLESTAKIKENEESIAEIDKNEESTAEIDKNEESTAEINKNEVGPTTADFKRGMRDEGFQITIKSLLKGIDDKITSEAKQNFYAHMLTKFFTNPQKFPNISVLIFIILEHLQKNTDNHLLTFKDDRAKCIFLLPSERCIVTSIYETEKKSEDYSQQRLIQNLLSTIHHVVMSVKNRNVEEESILLRSVAVGARRKTKKIDESHWACSQDVLSEFLIVPTIPNISEALVFLKNKISSSTEESNEKLWMLSSSVAILSGELPWDWIKNHVVDEYISPCLSRFGIEEPNEKYFTLFCDLSGK
ncbi:hypothetical protein AVEN_181244-1 [Araneus ventricosus]|uniref:Uncharacterized protein n=1 Tax=Araneus ventricosus TaxID=182803 RepID=A0A4Y2K4V1_ARAVE|nr:hypothetical protein AVEN_181244-1 [Araneus ventricosus]